MNDHEKTNIKNRVQLCTYTDRLGRGNIETLNNLLCSQFKDLFGTVHLLPFYYPIDGADAGFDPIDHAAVDNRLGDWGNIKKLSTSCDILADMIVNHVSSKSAAFESFLKEGSDSPYANLFLQFSSVFPDGGTQEELISLYRPRPGFPFTKITHRNGEQSIIWTTFTSDQIDINVYSDEGKKYLTRILDKFERSGIKMIRLDAAGYAVKKAGTNCFMIPETFSFISELTRVAQNKSMEVLVEIHSHYLTQIEISKHASWVYDFALPPLVLHALHFSDSLALQKWYSISPRNCITVLDTHDGIGIIDIASEKDKQNGLLDDTQVSDLVESIHKASNNTSRLATGSAASNVDLYQVNCTFFEALGKDANKYLLARLIQFFSPGIPQVYYVGLLAGSNDVELLNNTGVGRDINRQYFSVDQINEAMATSTVQRLIQLIRLRNMHPAFHDGAFSCERTDARRLTLSWEVNDASISAAIDLVDMSFTITSMNGEHKKQICDWDDVSTLLEQAAFC